MTTSGTRQDRQPKRRRPAPEEHVVLGPPAFRTGGTDDTPTLPTATTDGSVKRQPRPRNGERVSPPSPATASPSSTTPMVQLAITDPKSFATIAPIILAVDALERELIALQEHVTAVSSSISSIRAQLPQQTLLPPTPETRDPFLTEPPRVRDERSGPGRVTKQQADRIRLRLLAAAHRGKTDLSLRREMRRVSEEFSLTDGQVSSIWARCQGGHIPVFVASILRDAQPEDRIKLRVHLEELYDTHQKQLLEWAKQGGFPSNGNHSHPSA